ncbi:hypothetical protein PENSPDRAFT_82937 [Peniophora sp. CONT]|nr:hypothetical protein PENSPDRAFT_82937 [Peniophora sp. CONT]
MNVESIPTSISTSISIGVTAPQIRAPVAPICFTIGADRSPKVRYTQASHTLSRWRSLTISLRLSASSDLPGRSRPKPCLYMRPAYTRPNAQDTSDIAAHLNCATFCDPGFSSRASFEYRKGISHHNFLGILATRLLRIFSLPPSRLRETVRGWRRKE